MPVVLDRQLVLELARLLNEVVVSGDRIGSAFPDDPEKCDRVFGAYCREVDAVPRASRLRGELFEALWPEEPPEEDERIEAEMGARYWQACRPPV